jgi:hypothetical protein
VFIFLLFKVRFGELASLGIDLRAALGVDAGVVVADHGVVDMLRISAAALTLRRLIMLKWQARSRGRAKHASHM